MKKLFKSNKKILMLMLMFLISLACKAKSNGVINDNSVLAGLDVLVENDFFALKGKNVGLITNQTGINKDLIHNIDLFVKSDEFQLVPNSPCSGV